MVLAPIGGRLCVVLAGVPSNYLFGVSVVSLLTSISSRLCPYIYNICQLG